MRQFFIAAVTALFAIALAPVASAASPSQIDDWTGWYVGLSAGINWGSDPVRTTASNSQVCSVCGHPLDFANASILGATGAFPLRTDGFIGGGQLGHDWQIASRWVAGFETDFQGLAGAGNSSATSASFDVSGFAGHSVGTDLSVTKSIDFLGTVRGRVGYLVEPRLLVFGTGGLAYGHVKSGFAITQNLIGSGLGSLAASYGAASNVSTMRAGWTLGGGFEWKFAPKWTAQFLYLFYDLGKVTSHGQLADRIVSPNPPTTYYFVNDVWSSARFNGNIIRVALNYHF